MRIEEQGKQYQRGDDGAMSVAKLVRRMKNVLEIEIGDVWVEGEVSNLRKQANGHYYFSLKDEQAQLVVPHSAQHGGVPGMKRWGMGRRCAYSGK